MDFSPGYFEGMKTTVDIPESDLKLAMKNTGAKTKKEAVLKAVRELNRRQRLAELADRLCGSLPNFMTQEDLKIMREDAKWEAMK